MSLSTLLRAWRHRWTLWSLLNNVARGNEDDAKRVAKIYQGSMHFGRDLFRAAQDIIRPGGSL